MRQLITLLLSTTLLIACSTTQRDLYSPTTPQVVEMPTSNQTTRPDEKTPFGSMRPSTKNADAIACLESNIHFLDKPSPDLKTFGILMGNTAVTCNAERADVRSYVSKIVEKHGDYR